MTVFLVLGIAADDIFVLHDAWIQSKHTPELKTLEKKLAFTLDRAFRQMFVTSCTTSAAFLANFFSSLLPICTFGIYAALIVQVNFMLAVTYFPLALMAQYTMEQRMGNHDSTKASCLQRAHEAVFISSETFFGGRWIQTVIRLRKKILTVFALWFAFSVYESFQWKSLT